MKAISDTDVPAAIMASIAIANAGFSPVSGVKMEAFSGYGAPALGMLQSFHLQTSAELIAAGEKGRYVPDEA